MLKSSYVEFFFSFLIFVQNGVVGIIFFLFETTLNFRPVLKRSNLKKISTNK